MTSNAGEGSALVILRHHLTEAAQIFPPLNCTEAVQKRKKGSKCLSDANQQLHEEVQTALELCEALAELRIKLLVAICILGSR